MKFHLSSYLLVKTKIQKKFNKKKAKKKKAIIQNSLKIGVIAVAPESLQLQFLSHPILITSCFLCVDTAAVAADPLVITL